MLDFPKQCQRPTALAAFARMAIVLLGIVSCGVVASGQSFPAAENSLDLHVGGGFATASADYAKDRISGYSISGGIRLRAHIAEESEFWRLTDPKGSLSMTSLTTGISCSLKYRGISPYVKGLAGVGFLSNPSAKLVALSTGGGVDVTVMPSIHVRADYDYQSWPGELGFEQGFVAKMITFGVVYHIHPFDHPRTY